MKLRKLNTDDAISPIHATVWVKYSYSNKEAGGAFLHRSENDPNPIYLPPPDGQIEVPLLKPGALYLQEADGDSTVSIDLGGGTLDFSRANG